jgi:hypothetical protein
MKASAISFKSKFLHLLGLCFWCIWILQGCRDGEQENQQGPEQVVKTYSTQTIPEFQGDSAMNWVNKQVSFGPRIPGTKAHRECGNWMVQLLKHRGLQVMEQNETMKMHDGKAFELRNIIASLHPGAEKRIVLAAHWDTRPKADMDPVSPNSTFDGANDGASGVAVLLELSRHLDSLPKDMGIDLVFFDLEDYGTSEVADSYGIGAQFWSRHPHVTGYRAAKGILLDMVGAADARFCWEGHSLQFAPEWSRHIWQKAQAIGYGDLFVSVPCQPVTDDHYYVNTIAGIPMVDIIDLRSEGGTGFPPHWHTREDKVDVVSKRTLSAVGQTLIQVLYR